MKDNYKADVSHTDEFNRMYQEMVKQAEDKYKVKSEYPETEKEGLVEEENTDCENCGLTRNSIRCLFMDNCPHNKQKNIIEIPEDYVLKDENGNIIDTHKIVLEKKKKSVIREEQIDNAAQEYIDSDNAVLTYSDGFCEQTDHPFVRAAFKAGAEWADSDVTQDDCSKAPKLTSQDYSNGRFGYQLPAGFEAKLTERELILTPEKPKYPKSLLDCENVLNDVRNDRKKLLHKFNELLICRDALMRIQFKIAELEEEINKLKEK